MRFSVWPSSFMPFEHVVSLVGHCDATGWDGAYVMDHFMLDRDDDRVDDAVEHEVVHDVGPVPPRGVAVADHRDHVLEGHERRRPHGEAHGAM